MKPEDRKKLLLSDTQVPDLFISDYLNGLSYESVKAYLYLLLTIKHGKSIGEKEIASRFSLSVQDAKGAIAELSLAGLIEKSDKGKITLIDIKESEIDSYIRRAAQEPAEKSGEISPLDQAREELAGSIEKTFFHGSMAYKWYREIDMLLFDFGFDPDVVYMLFQSLYDNKQLTTLSQIKERALLWHSKGIQKMEELSVFLAGEEKVKKDLYRIGKRLRRKMTEFDEEYVRVWVEKLKYPYEVIDFAIRKMCEYNNSSTLKRADDHLKKWFAVGIRTIEEAEKYEEDQAIKNKLKYQREKAAGRQAGSGMPKQNFAGVTYSEEEIREFEDDPNDLLQQYAKERADSSYRRET